MLGKDLRTQLELGNISLPLLQVPWIHAMALTKKGGRVKNSRAPVGALGTIALAIAKGNQVELEAVSIPHNMHIILGQRVGLALKTCRLEMVPPLNLAVGINLTIGNVVTHCVGISTISLPTSA